MLATMGMLFTAAPALAQNAHFVSGPTLTCTGSNGACLNANFKVAGLGNTVSSTNCSLACTSIAVTGQCFTSSNKPVQGTTKSGNANCPAAGGTCTVRNGNVTGPLSTSLCPSTTNCTLSFNPGCTGNQRFEITSANYSQCTLTVDGTSQDALAKICPAS